MKKILSILLTVLLIAAIFTGCGSKKNLTISDCIDKGQTIWFKLSEDVGKDTNVETIYVLNDDETMIYTDVKNKTLGDFERLEDKEIIDFVEEEYKKNTNEKIKELLTEVRKNHAHLGSETDWNRDIKVIIDTWKDIDKNYTEEEYEVCKFSALADQLYSSFKFQELKELPKINCELSEESGYYGYDFTYFEINDFPSDEYTLVKDDNWKTLKNAMNSFYQKYPIIKETLEDCFAGKEYTNSAAKKLYDYFLAESEKTEEYKTANSELSKYIDNPVPAKYSLIGMSDDTGNHMMGEVIAYQDGMPLSSKTNDNGETEFYKNIEAVYFINQSIGFNYEDSGNCVELYKSFYGGFYYSEEMEKCVVTRFNKNIILLEDNVDDKGVLVDPSDETINEMFPQDAVFKIG